MLDKLSVVFNSVEYSFAYNFVKTHMDGVVCLPIKLD